MDYNFYSDDLKKKVEHQIWLHEQKRYNERLKLDKNAFGGKKFEEVRDQLMLDEREADNLIGRTLAYTIKRDGEETTKLKKRQLTSLWVMRRHSMHTFDCWDGTYDQDEFKEFVRDKIDFGEQSDQTIDEFVDYCEYLLPEIEKRQVAHPDTGEIITVQYILENANTYTLKELCQFFKRDATDTPRWKEMKYFEGKSDAEVYTLLIRSLLEKDRKKVMALRREMKGDGGGGGGGSTLRLPYMVGVNADGSYQVSMPQLSDTQLELLETLLGEFGVKQGLAVA